VPALISEVIFFGVTQLHCRCAEVFGRVRRNMGPVDLVIILLHPIAAIAVIVWMVRQHRWRQRGRLLKGEMRSDAVSRHERDGERLYKLAWIIVLSGFFGNALFQMRENSDISIFEAVLPTSAGALHAGGGLIGLILVTILWKRGRNVRDLREAGQSIRKEKVIHGRASDAIMVLIAIHAFLGFLWLMQLLS